MNKDVERVLYSERQIQDRVAEMGAQITKDYKHYTDAGERFIVLCTLRGAAVFFADLIRHIDLPLEIDFVSLSSYGMGVKSSGTVTIYKDISTDITGAHILITEDIIDSGRTLAWLTSYLKDSGAASVEIAAVLDKKDAHKVKVDCRYIGFDCPNEFIVGYGLDYAQRYRNLPYISILKKEVYS